MSNGPAFCKSLIGQIALSLSQCQAQLVLEEIIFEEISYDTVGEFTYIIREVEDSQEGVSYDQTVYQVIVRVTDDGEGKLVAEVDYVDGPAVFTNIYQSPEEPTDPEDPEDSEVLPKTGQSTNMIIPILGVVLITVGFVLRRRVRQ